MAGPLVWCMYIFITGVVTTKASVCPEDCFCREHYQWSRNVYVVTRYYKNMSVVPDLSPLSSISLPIYIKLSYSNLTRVTKADFPPDVRITFLNLGGNRRLVLDDDALSNIKDSLLYLDLESTRVFFNATLKFLRGISKLETLILSYNNVYNYQTVAPDVTVSLFGGLGLSSLKKLKMYKCGIRTISERVFQDAETIEELDLGANSLIDVPDAISAIPGVKDLDLSNSQFEVLKSRAFIHNIKLETLTVINSRIKTIDPNAFEGVKSSLQKLDLGNSSLSGVPDAALNSLTLLKALKLDRNKIKSIAAGSLSGSYCLEDLSLSAMDVPFIDDMFEGQENCIMNLTLRQMNLTNIPRKALLTLNKLQNLFLDNNLIHELKVNALSGIKASVLAFTGNPLKKIDTGAFNGTSRPLFVKIDFTRMKSVDFVLDYPEGTFELLDVTGLPISCDCTLARVINIMENYTLSGSCHSIYLDTGAGIGLDTDTLYQYLSGKCPGVLPTAGTTPKTSGTRTKDNYNATVVVFCLISMLHM